MLDLNEIRNALRDRKVAAIARFTGVHHNTIHAIKNGKASNPSYKVVKALSDYLRGGVANG